MDIRPAAVLKRRFASMLYEAMLVFGILFVSGLLFSTLLQQRHALYLRGAMQDWLFLVLGVYFVWCWTHGGQTLAMKTWQVRVVTDEGGPVKMVRAVVRYLLAWLWVLPGLALAWWLDAKTWMLILIPGVNVLLWAFATYLDPERQFLHDRIAGTRLVSTSDTPSPTAVR